MKRRARGSPLGWGYHVAQAQFMLRRFSINWACRRGQLPDCRPPRAITSSNRNTGCSYSDEYVVTYRMFPGSAHSGQEPHWLAGAASL